MPEHLDISGYLIAVETLEDTLRGQGYLLIPVERMQLASVAGYVKRYHELMATTTTYSVAWERVEWEFSQTFGCKRFDSWDSFRNSTSVKKVMGKE